MARNIAFGYDVVSNDPIDSRLVHNGRPWLNNRIIADTNGTTTGSIAALIGYEGLVAVDTSDDTLWLLTDATMANVAAGWTQQVSSSGTDIDILNTDGTDSGNDLASIRPGTNVTFTNTSGAVTINASGGGSSIVAFDNTAAYEEGDLAIFEREIYEAAEEVTAVTGLTTVTLDPTPTTTITNPTGAQYIHDVQPSGQFVDRFFFDGDGLTALNTSETYTASINAGGFTYSYSFLGSAVSAVAESWAVVVVTSTGTLGTGITLGTGTALIGLPSIDISGSGDDIELTSGTATPNSPPNLGDSWRITSSDYSGPGRYHIGRGTTIEFDTLPDGETAVSRNVTDTNRVRCTGNVGESTVVQGADVERVVDGSGFVVGEIIFTFVSDAMAARFRPTGSTDYLHAVADPIPGYAILIVSADQTESGSTTALGANQVRYTAVARVTDSSSTIKARDLASPLFPNSLPSDLIEAQISLIENVQEVINPAGGTQITTDDGPEPVEFFSGTNAEITSYVATRTASSPALVALSTDDTTSTSGSISNLTFTDLAGTGTRNVGVTAAGSFTVSNVPSGSGSTYTSDVAGATLNVTFATAATITDFDTDNRFFVADSLHDRTANTDLVLGSTFTPSSTSPASTLTYTVVSIRSNGFWAVATTPFPSVNSITFDAGAVIPFTSINTLDVNADIISEGNLHAAALVTAGQGLIVEGNSNLDSLYVNSGVTLTDLSGTGVRALGVSAGGSLTVTGVPTGGVAGGVAYTNYTAFSYSGDLANATTTSGGYNVTNGVCTMHISVSANTSNTSSEARISGFPSNATPASGVYAGTIAIADTNGAYSVYLNGALLTPSIVIKRAGQDIGNNLDSRDFYITISYPITTS